MKLFYKRHCTNCGKHMRVKLSEPRESKWFDSDEGIKDSLQNYEIKIVAPVWVCRKCGYDTEREITKCFNYFLNDVASYQHDVWDVWKENIIRAGWRPMPKTVWTMFSFKDKGSTVKSWGAFLSGYGECLGASGTCAALYLTPSEAKRHLSKIRRWHGKSLSDGPWKIIRIDIRKK